MKDARWWMGNRIGLAARGPRLKNRSLRDCLRLLDVLGLHVVRSTEKQALLGCPVMPEIQSSKPDILVLG